MDMEIIAGIIKLSRREHFWIVVLTLLVLVMHFSIIFYPDTIILDEVYYVNDARDIIDGDLTLRAEHPPLGELLVAAGILLFGDNPLGWRFFAILMGSANIWLLYLICRQLAMSRRASFLASFLLALENLTFVQSGVAMLDVYSLCFMLFAFWLYLKGNYPAASVVGCLGVLAKLTGALGFIVLMLHWLIARRDRRRWFMLSMIMAPALFLGLLPLFDAAMTGELMDPFSHIQRMFTLSGLVTFELSSHSCASHSWEWIILLKVMPYNFDPDYLAVISPTLWALIIPTLGYMAYKVRRGSDAALFGVLWFAVTYLIWIPANLIFDRVTYIYYFFPTVGSICLGLGMGLSEMLRFRGRRGEGKLRWLAVVPCYLYLWLHTAIFVALSPVFARWLPSVRDMLL